MQTDQITAALNAANIHYTPEAVAMLAECNAEPDWEAYREALAARYSAGNLGIAPDTPMSGRDRTAVHSMIAAHAKMPETKAMQARIAELEARERAACNFAHGFQKTVAKPDPDGWIEWHGGEMPVDGNEGVLARYRDGAVLRGRPASSFIWSHDGDICDIIAYRVLP